MRSTAVPRSLHLRPRRAGWIPLFALAWLQASSACAPLDDAEGLGDELGSLEDGGVLEDKALPSASYQAESRTGQSGCGVATNHPGYTGSGFMDFGGNGTWIEWNNISASAAGQYSLGLRYANASSDNRPSAILVNGKVVGNAPFAGTGGWDRWGTAFIDVSLVRGNNTIRVLANTSVGGPNLDRLDVVATDLCPSDATKVEAGLCGCGVPEGTCDGSGGGLLDRPTGTKLRIGSWNNFRGSIFPKTDAVWSAINISAKDGAGRVEGGARIFKAVKADIWLLQETVYSDASLPSGVTIAGINSKLAEYMRSLTGDPWSVRCNGRGLCTMIRGAMRFAESWNPGHRVAGNRVILADGSKVLVINVHYMNKIDQAEDTVDIVRAGANDAAVFIGGDFNNTTTGALYKVVAAAPGLKALSISQLMDPKARHLSAATVNAAPYANTKAQVTFGEGATGQDVAIGVTGGHIDHFFLRSAWGAANRFVLNSLLLSPATLAAHRMTALDVVLEPGGYETYFRDLLNRGIVYELPDAERRIDLDHLPMIVDFTDP